MLKLAAKAHTDRNASHCCIMQHQTTVTTAWGILLVAVLQNAVT